MQAGFDFQLVLALVLVALALGAFGYRLVATTRRVGLLMSESKVPRRYMVLGFAIGVALIYVTRR